MKGFKPKLSLGFNRPAEDIIDAPVIDVFKSKRGENAGKIAVFLLQGDKNEISWPCAVADLMILANSPVRVVDDVPIIDYEGMTATIPSDPKQEVAFLKV